MSSIGQSTPLSHYAGRYDLGDTQKYPDKSTAYINRHQLTRSIAMKVSKGLEFRVVPLPGVGGRELATQPRNLKIKLIGKL